MKGKSINSIIDEFNDYIGLLNFVSAYHYYFMDKEGISIIHEKNYGHSHDMKSFDLFSRISKAKLVIKMKDVHYMNT